MDAPHNERTELAVIPHANEDSSESRNELMLLTDLDEELFTSFPDCRSVYYDSVGGEPSAQPVESMHPSYNEQNEHVMAEWFLKGKRSFRPAWVVERSEEPTPD